MSIDYKTKSIESDRLILSKGTLNDYLSVYEYDFGKLRDIDGEFEYCKNNLAEIEKWFKPTTEEFYLKCEKNHVFDWVIYLKDSIQPIGNIVADRENMETNGIEISFNLHPNYWGTGYMPETIIVVMNYLFELGFENIIYGYDDGNIKSKKVSEKLGFKEFRIKKSDWVKNGKPIDVYETIMAKEKWLSETEKRVEKC